LHSGCHRWRHIGHIFGAGLILTGFLAVQRVDDEVGERLQDALNELDAAICELRSGTFTRVIAEGAATRAAPCRTCGWASPFMSRR